MLSALGESIEVTVELFASHVFLTPCLTHPGPAIHQDPEAWFGAQQGRLRLALHVLLRYTSARRNTVIVSGNFSRA